MDTYHKAFQQTIKTQVLVIGGGSAGAVAAIAAARSGVETLLVERYGFLGGTSTQVLDTFCGFYVYGKEPRKIVGGIPDDVIDALMQRGKALIRSSTYWRAGNVITYDPQTLKIIWEQLARDANVQLLYHTRMIDTIMQGNRITGVVAVNKRGLIKILAEVVIDASGDADVAVAAGVPYDGHNDNVVQALTTTFRMGNVDVEKAKTISEEALHALMKEAVASGDYQLPRIGGAFYETPLPGVMATNIVRIAEVDPVNPDDLTQAEYTGRQHALEYVRFFQDCVPGFEEAYLAGLSVQIGIRESRRVDGHYRLTRQDIENSRSFEDGIAKCGWPIEDHKAGHDTDLEYLPEGQIYDIPYRCLVPQNVDNLLVAGRCLSADHDAHASVRVMAQCMAMGQAVGIASATSVKNTQYPADTNIKNLRHNIERMGGIL